MAESLLSDQTDTLQSGIEGMKETQQEAETALAGVEAPSVTYGGTNAEQLKEESALDTGSSYVTPESTVAGQLESLLKTDSAYMQTAEKRAKEQAADLGLLGSSMAVGATQRAAIESALPIAQQDAETYAQAQLQEQATSNEISRMKAESDLSAAAREHVYNIENAQAKLQGTYNLILENAQAAGNAQMEAALTQSKATWDAEVKTSLAELDAELQKQLNQQQITASEKEYASTTSSNIMAASYGTINDLMGNADFMAAYADDPQGLQDVFNNFIDLAKNQVQFIGASAGLASEYNDPTTGYINLIGSWV